MSAPESGYTPAVPTYYGYFPFAMPLLMSAGSGDGFGQSLATADLDGDGIDDLVVGAPLDDASGIDAGRIDVYFGATVLDNAGRDATVAGLAAGDRFGTTLAAGGDLNGDGHEDVAIGAPTASGTTTRGGHVSVLWGAGALTSAEAVAEGSETDADFGRSLSLVDLNVDGYDDLVVGAPDAAAGGTARGAVYIYLGGASGPTGAVEATWTGANDRDRFGWGISAAADVSGEGDEDVVVTAPGLDGATTNGGGAYAYYGAAGAVPDAPGWEAQGTGWYGPVGEQVVAGDMNGDGYGDVFLASYDADAPEYYYGQLDGLPSIPTFEAPDPWFYGWIGGLPDAAGTGQTSLWTFAEGYLMYHPCPCDTYVTGMPWAGPPDAATAALLDDRVFVAVGYAAAGEVALASPAADADNDGYYVGIPTIGGDCDDSDDTIYPAADEVIGDGIDQDCDGVDAEAVAEWGSSCEQLTDWSSVEDSLRGVSPPLWPPDLVAEARVQIEAAGAPTEQTLAWDPTYACGSYERRWAEFDSTGITGSYWVRSDSVPHTMSWDHVSCDASYEVEEEYAQVTATFSTPTPSGVTGVRFEARSDPWEYSGHGWILDRADAPVRAEWSGGATAPYAVWALGSCVWTWSQEVDDWGNATQRTFSDGVHQVVVEEGLACVTELGADADSVVTYDGVQRVYRAEDWTQVEGEDADADGWPASLDCDETSQSVHPCADDVSGNLVDDDCDGFYPGDPDHDGDGVYDGADCAPEDYYRANIEAYPDDDRDDHGALGSAAGSVCGGAKVPDDCDDTNANVFPGAVERCDELDDDCDGELEEPDQEPRFPDRDLDQFGDETALAEPHCDVAGWTVDHTDCDDSDPQINPQAPDLVTDDIDSNCDGIQPPPLVQPESEPSCGCGHLAEAPALAWLTMSAAWVATWRRGRRQIGRP